MDLVVGLNSSTIAPSDQTSRIRCSDACLIRKADAVRRLTTNVRFASLAWRLFADQP
jgi:hypothetical protein